MAEIIVKGITELQAKIKKFRAQMLGVVSPASEDESNKLLDNTVGLRKYPPLGPGNAPPTPYYIRGTGMQYKSHNDNRSEQLGSRWVVKKILGGVNVYNTASYYKYVHGERQSYRMAEIGWKKTSEVFPKFVPEILKKIKSTFDMLMKKIGLK